jgi:hypothetical protein
MKMTQQHTPGPWNLTYGDHWVVGRDEVYGEIVIVKRGAGCEIANMNLIAAAPDLLAALEDALATLEGFEAQLAKVVGTKNLDRKIWNARAAIAKAKGQ